MLSSNALLAAVIEKLLRLWMKNIPQWQIQQVCLKGKVIQIHIKEINKTLTFIFGQQVEVVANSESAVDCYLSLSLSALLQLRNGANLTDLIKNNELVINGDIQVVQQFVQLFIQNRFDIEERLSEIVGDVVAHTLVQQVKSAVTILKNQKNKHQNHLAQVLTEEWRWLPAPLELAYFCEQVEQINRDTQHLENRINALLVAQMATMESV